MAKFQEAHKRLFAGMFVCRKCTRKVRSSSLKVSQGKASCRNCSSKRLRPKRKK